MLSKYSMEFILFLELATLYSSMKCTIGLSMTLQNFIWNHLELQRPHFSELLIDA
jgi:hypothetical protein